MLKEYNNLNFKQYFLEYQTLVYGKNLPEVTKTGKVKYLSYYKDPIQIHLTDGTILYLKYDDFNRFGTNVPRLGDTMQVTFLRNPNDKTKAESTIIKAIVVPAHT